jgi:hypothetical protein
VRDGGTENIRYDRRATQAVNSFWKKPEASWLSTLSAGHFR